MAARIEANYETQDGEFGTLRIIQSGRAAGSAVASLMAGVADGTLEKIPHTRGVAFKSFDGQVPTIERITPPLVGITYTCVKVAASWSPLAPRQTGGAFDGETVARYTIVWQQVGDLI